MKYVCEHIKSYLLQLAAPFVGKCHLFYYDVWNKRNEKNGLSGNIWLVSFKISYLCLPLFYETR
ncbi:hypothetical protein, partial [Bacteroides stercoris]|uniref:hypothetical protein n=2 Tax=Bacteroides TaxID=816 RepID=UPI003978DA83